MPTDTLERTEELPEGGQITPRKRRWLTIGVVGMLMFPVGVYIGNSSDPAPEGEVVSTEAAPSCQIPLPRGLPKPCPGGDAVVLRQGATVVLGCIIGSAKGGGGLGCIVGGGTALAGILQSKADDND